MQLKYNKKIEYIQKHMPEIIIKHIMEWLNSWHSDIAPKHFAAGANRKYGYENRSIEYQKKKAKRGLPPLVWSGRAKERLLRHGFFEVKGKANTATGRFIAGSEIRYFYMTQSRKKRGPNMADELTTVIDDEFEAMKNYVELEAIKELEAKAGNGAIIVR